MQVRIQPHPTNQYALWAVLLSGSDVAGWAGQLQQAGWPLKQCRLYPLPGLKPNTVYGCLVVMAPEMVAMAPAQLERFQLVAGRLLIPERSVLYPAVTRAELEQLPGKGQYLYHPVIGFTELETELDWKALLHLPVSSGLNVVKPADGVSLPGCIRSFRIQEAPPEEVLKQLAQIVPPENKKLTGQPLSFFEKLRLGLYNWISRIFSPSKKAPRKSPSWLSRWGGAPAGSGGLGGGYVGSPSGSGNGPSWLASLGAAIANITGGLASRITNDHQMLSNRNQDETDRLMQLFRDNPEEALKYAAPLGDGADRGSGMGEEGGFSMFQRWSGFNLFGQGLQSGGGSFTNDEIYRKLEKQYRETAEMLVRNGDYQKAAFVYLKLLKDYHQAAVTLEQGRLYAEAAVVYLQYCHNTEKAAACYEAGYMFTSALDLYKELKRDEKVGDLYMQLSQRDAAMLHYQVVFDQHCNARNYIKAATLSRDKMDDKALTRGTLLEGWHQGREAEPCLCMYLDTFEQPEEVKNELHQIYHFLPEKNRVVFIEVLKKEQHRDEILVEPVREMAYELVAAMAPGHPEIVSEIRHFNKQDKLIVKDIMQFKTKKRR